MDDNSIGQEFLPFKLGTTKETLTSRSGLAAFHGAALTSGVVAQIRKRLPTPCSNRGIRPEEYVMPIALILTGGGQCLEDIREIQQDAGLRKLCGFRHVPGADAIGVWLKVAYRILGMKPGVRRPESDFLLPEFWARDTHHWAIDVKGSVSCPQNTPSPQRPDRDEWGHKPHRGAKSGSEIPELDTRVDSE